MFTNFFKVFYQYGTLGLQPLNPSQGCTSSFLLFVSFSWWFGSFGTPFDVRGVSSSVIFPDSGFMFEGFGD